MKPSFLTLRELTFLGIRIEVDPEYSGQASDFDFEGASLHWGIRHGRQDDEGLHWWVGIDFATKFDDNKRCPYQIDVKAMGLFKLNESVPKENREKFVYENGAALVFGAIREMVTMTSARSAHGAIMLPTASFFGTFEEHQKKRLPKVTVEPKSD